MAPLPALPWLWGPLMAAEDEIWGICSSVGCSLLLGGMVGALCLGQAGWGPLG